jgi:hypothetical protein
MTLNDLSPLIQSEMDFAHKKYGNYHNAHEQYAVLQEEVDEWWDEVKANNWATARSQYELLQVASVALRWLIERAHVDNLKDVQDLRHR